MMYLCHNYYKVYECSCAFSTEYASGSSSTTLINTCRFRTTPSTNATPSGASSGKQINLHVFTLCMHPWNLKKLSTKL